MLNQYFNHKATNALSTAQFIVYLDSRVWGLRSDVCHCGELLSGASAFASVITENGLCSVDIVVYGEVY